MPAKVRQVAGQQPLFRPKGLWSPTPVHLLPSWVGVKRLGLDLETEDRFLKKLGPGVRRGGRVIGVSFAIEDGPSHYLPIGHVNGNLPSNHVWDYLRENAKKFTGIVVGANLQYDLDYLLENGVDFPRLKWFRDVQIAAPLIDDLKNSYSLENIALDMGLPGKDERMLNEAAEVWRVDPKKGMHALPSEYVGTYATWDAELPLKILRRQERQIEEQGLQEIFDLESRVLPVCLRMRRRGVAVSEERLEKVELWADAEGEKLLREVESLTGVRLSMNELNDSDAVAKPLLQIGVNLTKTKQKKYSVNAELLQAIDHPVGDLLHRAKKMHNVRVKFGNGIRKHLVKGRIHCTFNQLRMTKDEGSDDKGTRYGRVSSTDPNMQQQPSPDRDPEIGKRWRSIYVPDDGGLWAACDYSQQEPRMLVHFAELCNLSRAREMADRYRTDPKADNHDMMTRLIHGDHILEEVGKKQFKQLRAGAKIIFLGKSYGMGGAKLCRSLGLPTQWVWSTKRQKNVEVAGPEGQAIMDQFNRQLPFVQGLADMCEKQAKNNGYIKTLLGRRCRFPRKPNGEYDWAHKALNRLIQGSSADQTKAAMVQLDAAGVPLQLQVHDEVDLTVSSRAEAEDVAEIMRTCVNLNVPSRVDVEIGPSWGEAV